MADAEPGKIIASRYRVLRELGRGGMGVVYVVEHVHTGDHLALKLLLGNAAMDAGALERFKREARASARIKSEHVVKVVDADTAPELQGAPFLVMELLNGSDLQKKLESSGRLPPQEAMRYLIETARALDKSHAMGIVHRDLKPENLFLHTKEDGSVILKILDFGISKLVGNEAGNDMAGVAMTSTGTVMGTPLYMAPEQARGRVSEIGPATDIWAMGLIAMQLLTGDIYWRANTVAELMSQILAEPLYPPSQRWPLLPAGIDAWFLRSCARDPAQRFARVGEQMQLLAELLGLAPPRPGNGPNVSPHAATISAPAVSTADASGPHAYVPIAGTRTTTGAVSNDGRPLASPRSSKGFVAATVAVFAIAVAGVGGWRWRANHAPPPSVVTATGDRSVAQAASTTLPPIAETLPSISDSTTPNGVDAGSSVATAVATTKPVTPRHSAHPPATIAAQAPTASTEAPPAPGKKPYSPSGL